MVLTTSCSTSGIENTSLPPTDTTVHSLTPTNVTLLETSLSSPDTATQAKVLATDDSMANSVTMSPGTVVKLQPSTFGTSGGVYAHVEAILTNGSVQKHVQFELTLMDNSWKIFAMEEVKW